MSPIFYTFFFIIVLFTPKVRTWSVHFYSTQLPSYEPGSYNFIQFYNNPKFHGKMIISWEIYSNSNRSVQLLEKLQFSSYLYAIHAFQGNHDSHADFYKPFQIQMVSSFSTTFFHFSQDLASYKPISAFFMIKCKLYFTFKERPNIYQFLIVGKASVLHEFPSNVALTSLALHLTEFSTPPYKRHIYLRNPTIPCTLKPKMWSPIVPPCTAHNSVISMQANIFNFTATQSPMFEEIGYATFKSVPKVDVISLVEFSECQIILIYSKKEFPINKDWIVWFTPYEKFVWIATFLSFSIIALISWIAEGIKDEIFTRENLEFQIFFQISILMRQPIRNFNGGNIIPGFISLVLLCAYETFISGRLIAPTPPIKFRHVGDLVNSGYKVDFDYAGNPRSPDIKTIHDVKEEFRKYGILHKLNSTFVDLSHVIDELRRGNRETQFASHFMQSKLGNSEMFKIRRMQMTGTAEEFKRGQEIYCDFVTLGNVRPVYFLYSTRLLGEMRKVHKQLMAGGFIWYWDSVFWNWHFLRAKAHMLWGKVVFFEISSEELFRKLLIELDSLRMLFFMWVFFMVSSSLEFLSLEVKLHLFIKILLNKVLQKFKVIRSRFKIALHKIVKLFIQYIHI